VIRRRFAVNLFFAVTEFSLWLEPLREIQRPYFFASDKIFLKIPGFCCSWIPRIYVSGQNRGSHVSTVMDDIKKNASNLAFLREFRLFDEANQPTRDFWILLKIAAKALSRRRLFSQEAFDAVDDVVVKIAEQGRAAFPDWPADGKQFVWLRNKVLNHIQTKSLGHDVTKKSDKDTQMENTLRSPDTTPSAVAAQQYLERFEGFLKEQPDADRLRAILPFIHLTKDRPKMAVLMGLSEEALNLEVKNFARAVKQFVELFGTFDFFTE
jgi:hypothetical protein